jgi:hypothetical protein
LETDTVKIIIANDGYEEEHIEKAMAELRRRGILPEYTKINPSEGSVSQ